MWLEIWTLREDPFELLFVPGGHAVPVGFGFAQHFGPLGVRQLLFEPRKEVRAVLFRRHPGEQRQCAAETLRAARKQQVRPDAAVNVSLLVVFQQVVAEVVVVQLVLR